MSCTILLAYYLSVYKDNGDAVSFEPLQSPFLVYFSGSVSELITDTYQQPQGS